MVDFYVSKHRIDFIDVWMDEEYVFYPKQNYKDNNNFFKYFNGIFQEQQYSKEFKDFYESNWKIPVKNKKLIFKNEFFNNDFKKWVGRHTHFKFSFSDDYPEEELFYFKLKYC